MPDITFLTAFIFHKKQDATDYIIFLN